VRAGSAGTGEGGDAVSTFIMRTRGQRLQMAFAFHRVSQQYIAKQSGISQQMMNFIVNDKRGGERHIVAIANALGDQSLFAWFMDGSNPPLWAIQSSHEINTEINGSNALKDVIAERMRQDSKWGEQNHDPFLYLTILGEEYGETCQAALEAKFGKGSLKDLREEAVQTAAVALAIVECLDRKKWGWSTPAVIECKVNP
jgi:NTP pyrophosphatase (non-canonical NTP hydrolase)